MLDQPVLIACPVQHTKNLDTTRDWLVVDEITACGMPAHFTKPLRLHALSDGGLSGKQTANRFRLVEPTKCGREIVLGDIPDNLPEVLLGLGRVQHFGALGAARCIARRGVTSVLP